MNRSIDKWFSQPVECARNGRLAAELYDYAALNATSKPSRSRIRRVPAKLQFRQLQAADENCASISTLQGDSCCVIRGEAQVTLNAPASWPEMKDRFPLVRALHGDHPQFQWGKTSYIVGAALAGDGYFWCHAAARSSPKRARYRRVSRLHRISATTEVGSPHLSRISSSSYCALLFASTWLACFCRRLVNRPVARSRPHGGHIKRPAGLSRDFARRTELRSLCILQQHG